MDCLGVKQENYRYSLEKPRIQISVEKTPVSVEKKATGVEKISVKLLPTLLNRLIIRLSVEV